MPDKLELFIDSIDTPIGELLLLADDAGNLRALAAAGTPFQHSVWREPRNIPTGAHISYGKLAERIDKPIAVRAVGRANGSNPICIFVPCHRVIGSNGALTGYGGGLERKQWLLEHERKHVLAEE